MVNRDNQGGENNQEVTDGVDAYYESEDTSKSGSAILYGLFALVVTLIVAAGLFFGGRAVYRALTGTSGDNETTQQGDDNSSADNKTENDNKDTDDSKQGQTPGVSSDTSSGSSSEGEHDNGSSFDSDSSTSMPSTGDNLPATGSPTGM
jgi:hypothetical protein